MAVKETNQNTFSKSQNLFSKNSPKNPRTWETSETNLFSCELRSSSFFFMDDLSFFHSFSTPLTFFYIFILKKHFKTHSEFSKTQKHMNSLKLKSTGRKQKLLLSGSQRIAVSPVSFFPNTVSKIQVQSSHKSGLKCKWDYNSVELLSGV